MTKIPLLFSRGIFIYKRSDNLRPIFLHAGEWYRFTAYVPNIKFVDRIAYVFQDAHTDCKGTICDTVCSKNKWFTTNAIVLAPPCCEFIAMSVDPARVYKTENGPIRERITSEEDIAMLALTHMPSILALFRRYHIGR